MYHVLKDNVREDNSAVDDSPSNTHTRREDLIEHSLLVGLAVRHTLLNRSRDLARRARRNSPAVGPVNLGASNSTTAERGVVSDA
jgi:Arc/MetJ family transcription regulator